MQASRAALQTILLKLRTSRGKSNATTDFGQFVDFPQITDNQRVSTADRYRLYLLRSPSRKNALSDSLIPFKKLQTPSKSLYSFKFRGNARLLCPAGAAPYRSRLRQGNAVRQSAVVANT